MTITEANAVQAILRVVIDESRQLTTDEIDAGAVLADHSHKALMAGVTGDEWRRQIRMCPEHGIPDCSPLLNACSWRRA